MKEKRLSIKKAIDFISDSWDDVSSTTTKNCWRKTGILPNIDEPEADNINQHIESNILLENNEIEEIISKLPDESQYAPETAHAVATYLEIVDEPIATEEVLNDEEIIATVQAEKNKEPIGKDEDEDGEPDPPVSAAKVCNAMQTVIHYEEQENSESNLTLVELGFLRKLLKKYKHIYEKSKKQTRITSFFDSQDLYLHNSSDPYPQESYSKTISKIIPKNIPKTIPKNISKTIPKTIPKITMKITLKTIPKAIPKAIPETIPKTIPRFIFAGFVSSRFVSSRLVFA
ncbi:CENP-b protein 1 [Gigaspora margarita]|uniref:CENP-b protein 1 n=1 Tax=Gigaspora margarita TaxID=4874 RepID=A0A8H3XGP1_GIGMA|nr:CENP-b protein 1 [Gigaspora margarita]